MDNRFQLSTVYTVGRDLARIFFAGKACVVCGSGIAEPQGVETGPALRSLAGVTTAWFEMSIEQLEHAVLSDTAVCARCHETGQRADRYDQLSSGAVSVEPRYSTRILFLRRATTRISGGTPVQPAI